MKAGWEFKKLEDLIEVQNGYAFKSNEYSEDGHFVMRIGNVQNGLISLADPKFVNLQPDSSLSRFELFENDILVSLTGNVGRVGVIENKHLPAVLNQRVARIRPIWKAKANREFLLYFLTSHLFREELSGAGHGAAQQNVSTKDLLKISIPIPPLSEQAHIVGILDEAFASIATAKANTQKNLENAKAVFESHLSKDAGPKGRLGDLVHIKTGKLDANAAVEGGQYPFFTCSRDVFSIDSYAFDCEAILLAGNNAVGDFNVKHYKGKFNAYQRTYVITVNEENSILYRFLYFQMLKSLRKFKMQSVGAGTKFLKIGMINDLEIFLPSISEQARIVSNIDAIQQETSRLTSLYTQKLSVLENLKKSLLHQAFTGKL